MNRELLKEAIFDQKEAYLFQSFVVREYNLELNVNYCFVGIRRSGKSFLVYQLIHEYLKAGIPQKRIFYVNFEDERLLECDTADLNTILEIAVEATGQEGKPYLFFDEIQNIRGWDKFVRRLADTKYTVSITGSNSKMMSREVASTLGGRYIIKNVYPYNFPTYLTALCKSDLLEGTFTTRNRAEISPEYDCYLHNGAFPELLKVVAKRDYLSNIYQTIYLGDVLARNNITNDFAIRLIIKKIAETVRTPVSFSRMANILKSAGVSMGKATIIKYIDYILDAYIMFPVYNYAAKLVEKETSPKYFFMDNGLLSLFCPKNESALLENLVAIELIRRYGMSGVFFYERNVEVDFYVPDENLAIQVSYKILDDLDTFERETKALIKLNKHLGNANLLIITNSEEKKLTISGVIINVVPAWKWLASLC